MGNNVSIARAAQWDAQKHKYTYLFDIGLIDFQDGWMLMFTVYVKKYKTLYLHSKHEMVILIEWEN